MHGVGWCLKTKEPIVTTKSVAGSGENRLARKSCLTSSKLEQMLGVGVAIVWICLGGVLTIFSLAPCLFFQLPESSRSCELTIPPIALISGFPLLVVGVLGMVLGVLSLVWKKGEAF
jgi:hypothetical protein